MSADVHQRLERMRHALRCIALDAGLPIEGRQGQPFFDLDMCRELAAFGLSLEPDVDDIGAEVEAYRKLKTT